MANFFDILSGGAAADAATAAGQTATHGINKAGKQLTAYGDTLPGVYGGIASAYDPYVQGGGTAYQAGLTGLGLAGTPQEQQAFAQNFANTPGYQFAFDQGNQALQRQQQAGPGGGAGGAAMKAAIRYGQGYANTNYQDYLKTLLGLGQQGQAAVGSRAGIQGQGVQGQLGTRQTAYGGAVDAAKTAAAAQVAAANAQMQGWGNIFGAVAGGAGKLAGMGSPGGYMFGSGMGVPGASIPSGWPVG
jgi:hypothetical protein